MGKNSEFQKEFFNELINNYGFFVEAIGEENSLWIASKTVNSGGRYSVIISKEHEEEENYNRAKEHLEKSGVPYSIHNIILCRKVETEYSNEEFSLGRNYNRVLIDISTKKVVLYNKNSEPLAKILSRIFSKPVEPKKPWYKRIKVGKTTGILMAMNIIIFLASVIIAARLTGDFFTNLFEVDYRVLYLLGAKDAGAILRGGEVYRLVTSMFLHGGIIHLAFNMYALYALGDTVESIYGRAKYLAIYFLSGIIASLTSTFLSSSMGVGASGAIFGLLGAALIFAIHEKERVGKQFLINVVVVIVVNILIGLGLSNIDNYAHLGGLVGGMALSFFFYRYKIVSRLS